MPSRSVSPDTQLLIDQELPRLIQAVKNLANYKYGKIKILAAVRGALREVKEEKIAAAPVTVTPAAENPVA